MRDSKCNTKINQGEFWVGILGDWEGARFYRYQQLYQIQPDRHLKRCECGALAVPEDCGHCWAWSLCLSWNPKGKRMCMGGDWAGGRDGRGGGNSKNRRSEVRLEESYRRKGCSPAWDMMFV